MFLVRNSRHRTGHLLNLILVLAGLTGWMAAPCYSSNRTQDESYALTASPNTAAPKDTLTAGWTAPVGSSATDWVGLYKTGTSDQDYLWWQYTDGATSGSASTEAPGTPGTYEFRYFLNDVYTKVATSNQVTVSAPILVADVARFLQQSTFGLTPELIAHVQNVGFEEFLSEQFNAPASSYPTMPLYPTTRNTNNPDMPYYCPDGPCQR
ncbi:MAG: hypothetical protein H0T92_17230, partial [Pyrinomonadaceae bacterium]|nr:hypothetical protein [Pyrinomonadaceae bacterium]